MLSWLLFCFSVGVIWNHGLGDNSNSYFPISHKRSILGKCAIFFLFCIKKKNLYSPAEIPCKCDWCLCLWLPHMFYSFLGILLNVYQALKTSTPCPPTHLVEILLEDHRINFFFLITDTQDTKMWQHSYYLADQKH